MRKEVEELNEIFLWKKVKSGDTESFSQVFKFYYPSLFTYGIKLVGLPDFVRDQIQELFINIWETRQNLGDVKNLKAYLFISLRRRLFSSQKLNLKLNFVEDLPEAAHRSLIFEDREFVDREFISANLKAILIRNLNDLPSNQREIIFLKFFHRLTYKEIAKIINVKEQSVKNIMPKILKKLATD
jgi:RNA polymerase sigma-70 factor (ECF subfamily)